MVAGMGVGYTQEVDQIGKYIKVNGSQVSTVRERSYKYEKEEKQNKSCGSWFSL